MSAVYHVAASGGADSGAGTSASPWATLQRAADSVRAGDTVIVHAGDYTGFDLRTSGTASQRITFTAESGVLINARNARTADGINLEGASYVTVDGFNVHGIARAGIRSVLNEGVVIRNNSTDSNGKWGIFTGWSENILIENNVTTRSVAEHGIYVSNSADNPIIRGNVVWGNRASGIQINADGTLAGDGVVTNALIENNIIYKNGTGGGAAINLDGVQASRVQNNLLYDNHASGVVLYRFNGSDGSKNNIVVNNTIVQAADARWGVYISVGSTGNSLYNNIIYTDRLTRGSIAVSADSLPQFKSDYNVLVDRMSATGDASVVSLAAWQVGTGQDKHSIVSTPAALFLDVAGADYRLSALSAAVDAGVAMLAPQVDLENSSRPQGLGWDIGAYERNGAPVDTTAPSVTLTSPNGGQTLITGATTTVTWQATDNLAVSSVDLYYSADGGRTYALIDAGLQNSGSYLWKVSAAATNQGRVCVVARDAAGNTAAAASEANFTLAPATSVSTADLIGFDAGNWYVGTSNGDSFSFAKWASWSNSVWTAVAQGDFDGDGRQDVLGLLDGTWQVGRSSGAGFATSVWGGWSNRSWRDVVVGDLNGDGKDDILARTGGNWWAAISTGTSFGAPTRWTSWADAGWKHVTVTDLNGDGKVDLLANLNGAWWAGLSTGSNFSLAQRWARWADVTWDAIGTFDANNDGKTDIFGLLNGSWYVGQSTGGGFDTSLRASWANAAWKGGIAGDFNDDGRDDVAARLNGAWWVSLSTPLGYAGSTSRWAVWKDVGWTDVTVGDFDADGKVDLAARLGAQWWVGRSTGAVFQTSLWGSAPTTSLTAITSADATGVVVSGSMAPPSNAAMTEEEYLSRFWSLASDDEKLAAGLLSSMAA